MTGSSESRLRVLIAEDQYLMREGTRRLLAEVPGIDVVGEAFDYDSVLAETRRLEPAVVLMDIKMPPTHSMEGIEAAHVIRRSCPTRGWSFSASTTTKATSGPCSRAASRGTATSTRCVWAMSISSCGRCTRSPPAARCSIPPGSSVLTYSAGNDRYHYVWKTEKSWAGTCRQLVVLFKDGSERKALFRFR